MREERVKGMEVFIRVDASIIIGTGHVMRTLTIAEELKENGAKVSFICRELPGNLCDFIEDKGYIVFRLPVKKIFDILNNDQSYIHWLGSSMEQDVEDTIHILEKNHDIDWLIVDHYAIDKSWETKVKKHTKKVVVIDDLANREHDSDILLDQNLYPNLGNRYDNLVPNNCIKLLGPQFALLRKEFKLAKSSLKKRDGRVNRILIFFGGSDPTNSTEKAIKAIQLMGEKRNNIAVDVIVGQSNPNKENIKQLCEISANFNYYCQVENIADLIVNADLAIGAGGSSTWERCYLGLPSITMILAENQFDVTEEVASKEAVINLGYDNKVTIEKLSDTLYRLIQNPALISKMSENGLELMDNHSDELKSLLDIMMEAI